MRPHFLFPLILTFVLGACGSTSELKKPEARGWSPYPSLAFAIDSLLPDTLFPPSNAGILIHSLTRNEPLYSLNSDLLFTPASNQKLFTAATVLDLLGPGFQLRTECFVAGDSSLVIRGGGDPLLRTADIDSIARRLSGALTADRTWSLAADISLFDSIQWGRGWMWDDDPGDYVMRISPLSVNGNAVRTILFPANSGVNATRTEVIPPTSYVHVDNGVRIWERNDDSLIVSRTAVNDREEIALRGSIERKTKSVDISVINPVAYWLTLLGEALDHYGIKTSIEQTPRVVPDGIEPVWTRTGSLDSAIVTMMKQSDNLSAEVLFRLAGQVKTGRPGSTKGGAMAVKNSLSGFGIDTSAVLIADGSGVSRYNLVSAATLVDLLEGVSQRPDLAGLFESSLPVAGVDGTLRSRMKGTAAEGNLRAKTGTASGLSSLTGYVRTADGELLCFSILMGQYAGKATPYRNVQDAIGALLASMRRRNF
ncbi:MAG: D-alanyl-D-alanine carboxypeptidase/D-alanyl-D-alanine-endopeptidase [Ignavibacteria bacterium]|nr:D-alanyl-D-alanine carboxypeptidase/D-alanyl-D-alanine-endopeptidase [Ignavibacteria bacterium]